MPALPPDFTEALVWYEAHAPAALPPPASWPAPSSSPSFDHHLLTPPEAPSTPVVSDVELADLDGDRGSSSSCATCDTGWCSSAARTIATPASRSSPACRTRARHGNRSRQGRHHRSAHRGSRRVPAARSRQGLGRLAARTEGRDVLDVRDRRPAADGRCRSRGLRRRRRSRPVVGAFGYRKTGERADLRERTTDWKNPSFAPATIDARPGAMRALPVDLDGDGRMDFVAAISQKHEAIVAYHNDGALAFTPVVLISGAPPELGHVRHVVRGSRRRRRPRHAARQRRHVR